MPLLSLGSRRAREDRKGLHPSLMQLHGLTRLETSNSSKLVIREILVYIKYIDLGVRCTIRNVDEMH